MPPEHAATPVRPDRLMLHVGLPKSGTSYLQSVLRGNLEAIAEDGVALVPVRRAGTFAVALQVRDLVVANDGPRAHRALDRFEQRLARCQAPTALLTQEALAPTTPRQAAALLERAQGREVHVVITARDFARQLASAWQQRIQDRHTFTFAELLTAIQRREEPALDLWRNQDLPQIVQNWCEVTSPERVHVVTNPPPGSAEGLLDRFCQVVGIDVARLDLQVVNRNASLGYVQAELLRRVNVSLGDRLRSVRHGYGKVGKKWLAEQFLQSQGGPPARLPESMRGWCEELSTQWIASLRSSGCHVVGDLDDLRPSAGVFEDVPEPTTDELLAAAVQALADILQDRHDEAALAAAGEQNADQETSVEHDRG